jgi:hypothetical protein
MKQDTKRIAAGIFFTALGALIALGPWYLFEICEQAGHHGSGGPTNCWWTARAEIGAGTVIALLGIAYVLIKDFRALAALSLALAFNGTLAFIIPNALTGMCESARMRCRLVTLPALNILSASVVIAAAAGAAWLYRKSRAGGEAG